VLISKDCPDATGRVAFLPQFDDQSFHLFWLVFAPARRSFANRPDLMRFSLFLFRHQPSLKLCISEGTRIFKSSARAELEEDFKRYLGKKEIYKALKDTIENSQNILLILDDNKKELQEVFETYTDTWDKIVQLEILKEYTAEGKTIFTMNPDFEDIGFIEPPEEEEEIEEKYTENFHLEDVEKNIVTVYGKIKAQMLGLDSSIRINPQKYYISLRKSRNFAYLELRKKKMHIIIMLPYDAGQEFIKKHKLTQLSAGIQKFYNGPCFRVTIDNEEYLDEIINALTEAYRQQN